MKGLGKMVAFIATSLAALACQGCVTVSTDTTTTPAQLSYQTLPYESQTAPTNGPNFSLNSKTVWTQSDHTEFVERFSTTSPLFAPVDPIVSIGTPSIKGEALSAFTAGRVSEQITDIPREQRAFNGEIALSAPAGSLEIGIAPRFSIVQDGAFSTRRVGGEVRIGQNFDQRGEGNADSSWYLFAGADGEALVWEPSETGNMDMSVEDMALRDKVTVGDLQAGLSLQRGTGELSLSYIRREVEYRDRAIGASETEDFAGISFTLRH